MCGRARDLFISHGGVLLNVGPNKGGCEEDTDEEGGTSEKVEPGERFLRPVFLVVGGFYLVDVILAGELNAFPVGRLPNMEGCKHHQQRKRQKYP